MARETFTWFPDVASECSEAPAVNITKFGDGYEARIANVINSNAQSWSVKFTKGRAEALLIRDFLRKQGAIQSFLWANPFNETSKYVCDKWSTTPDRGKITISAVFREVFEE